MNGVSFNCGCLRDLSDLAVAKNSYLVLMSIYKEMAGITIEKLI